MESQLRQQNKAVSSAGLRPKSGCSGKAQEQLYSNLQTLSLVREGATKLQTCNCLNEISRRKQTLVNCPRLGSIPSYTDWLTVSRNVTLTLTWLSSRHSDGLRARPGEGEGRCYVLGGGKRLFLLHGAYYSSGAHPAFYRWGTGDPVHGSKADEAWTCTSIPSNVFMEWCLINYAQGQLYLTFVTQRSFSNLFHKRCPGI
jgi:hypothetical protein